MTNINAFWDDFHDIYQNNEIVYDLVSHNGIHIDMYDTETDEIINCGYLKDNLPIDKDDDDYY
jgi:hypothetical protein